MTLSVADTAFDIEKKAIKHCAQRNRHSWLTCIYCGMFMMSFTSFYAFWYTDTFSDYVLSHLKLENGSRTFDWFQNPPIKVQYRIRIFNYTNVKEFEAGTASKLRVQELGPYIYQETKNRVNVVMHENSTVTFQEKRSYEWIGGRPENDIVVIPNIPLMFTIAFVRDLSFPLRFITNSLLASLRQRTFINETVGGFLWGYKTPLFDLAKPLIMLKENLSFDKFGLLVVKNGVNKDRITMNTGSRSLDDLGIIERVNGKDNRKIWGDEKCDKIMGGDGTMFPPHLIKNTSNTLYVYSHEMCRNLPFRFAEQETTYGIPSLRYKFTPDAFNYSDTQNKCFCPKVGDSRVCPPAGLFNLSACAFDTPFLLSFPHFYGADESLLNQIDGLNPCQENHESYADVHPRLAVPMAGWSRIQMNLEVRKAIAVPFLGELKDGMILPLVWMEIGTDEIPESILKILQTAHFTATNVEMALQWGSFIAMIFSLSALLAVLWKYHVQRDKETFPKRSSV